eukprot:evm.model.scf_1663.6 EVM.evm.TU.scf_1663.6   scf_1663:30314-33934(-)
MNRALLRHARGLAARRLGAPRCCQGWRAAQRIGAGAASGRGCRVHAASGAGGEGTIPKDLEVRSLTKDDVEVSFARSSGPGGQNVNKVNTKVDMRLKLDEALWLPEEAREALKRQEKKRINKEGVLVVTSTQNRTQLKNIEDALGKLQAMIDRAVESVREREVDPELLKELEKRKKRANENRLQSKKFTSMRKAERRMKDW